jgi:hypothetical protein
MPLPSATTPVCLSVCLSLRDATVATTRPPRVCQLDFQLEEAFGVPELRKEARRGGAMP